MITRPPLPSTDDGAKPSAQGAAATADARPPVEERRADETRDLDEQERARLERTARYLKGPTAFSA
ncbi:hypothetical protein [Microvirga puerhi]|uniref:Uncharacterized protein n=1 Tax=Microvirga puerhi TaxID=2876078 RepID=A0ABS7VRG9_9HYPH|nr:hypothetical protein [Microvirga puerhi]MBZ6078153.1 hypothetical protein [Microvirga puerhi]